MDSPPRTSFPIDDVAESQAYLARLARSLVSNRADADDLVQEVWTSALEQPGGRILRLRGWLRTAAVHAAGRRALRDRGRTRREAQVARSELVPSTAESIERDAFLAELWRRARALEEPYREVLRLRFEEDRTPEEIAHLLGRPSGTVRSQLKRGLDKLRADLDRRYGRREGWSFVALALARPAARTATLRPAALGAALATALAVAVGIVLLVVRTPRPSFAAGEPGPGLVASGEPGLAGPGERRALGVSAPEPGAGRVRIRAVREGSDAPASGVEVWLEPLEPGGTARAARTDEEGRTEVAELRPGPWRAAPERGAPATVELAPGATAEVLLRVPDGAALEGRLVDERGAPVAGGEVLVSLPGRAERFRVAATSGADGAFRVEGVDGEAWIAARKAGHAPSHAYVLRTLRGDPRSGEVRIALVHAARAEGRVVDRSGRPVAGARVLARGIFFERPSPSGMGVRVPPPGRETTTDADGRFAIDKDRVEIERFVVLAEGFAPAWCASRAVGTEPETLELVLDPPAALGVRVLAPDGTPAAGAALELDLPEPLPPRCAESDERGGWRFEGLPHGAFALRARGADGALSACVTVEVGAEERTLTLVLGSAATITGRLLDASGTPLAGARVVLEEQDQAWERLRRSTSSDLARLVWTRTDAAGRFAFPACLPLEYELRALAEDDALAPPIACRTNVRPGAEECRLRAEPRVPLGDLAGIVMPWTPLPRGTTLALRARGIPEEQRLDVEPTSGRFAGTALPAGDYAGRLFLSGYPVRELGRIRVEKGARVDLGALELPEPGALAIVLGGASCAELPGLELVLVGEGTVWNSIYDASAFRFEPDGSALVERLWPGDYQLALRAPGYADRLEPVAVRAGETSRLELALRAGIPVDLCVCSPVPLEARTKLTLELEVDGRVVVRRRVDPSADPTHLYVERVTLEPGAARLDVRSDSGRHAERSFRPETLGIPAQLALELPPPDPSLVRSAPGS